MRIHFLCSSGSPLGVTPPQIYDRGVGGAELALLTLSIELAKVGHDVTVYNDPKPPGDYEGAKFRMLRDWNHADERDAVIMFRTPHHTFGAARGKRIFWSCDQFTAGDYRTDIFPFADKVVCISPRHAAFFAENYQFSGDKVVVMDLGVRTWDYPKQPSPKIRNRLIYCSVPDRGLSNLYQPWKVIKAAVPDATLVITSDYRLWGFDSPGNHEHRLAWAAEEGIEFVGMVSRQDLCVLQASAEIHAYPCDYDELFCISAAECAVAGAVPITSKMGALATTNRSGVTIDGDPRSGTFKAKFANEIVSLLTTRRNDLELMCGSGIALGTNGIGDFSWSRLVKEWEKLLS